MQGKLDVASAIAALPVALAVLAVPPGLDAAVLTYPGASPCNTTLQACVTGASAGDTIGLATNSLIAEAVTIQKSLVLQPAPGFAPELQSLLVFASTTSIDFTVQRLAGLHGFRALIGPGGGNLTVRVLDNVIDSALTPFAPVEVEDGTSPGTFGTKTVIIDGNRISEPGDGSSCSDAVLVLGTSTGLDATITDNDIAVDDLSQCGGIAVVVGAGQSGTALIDRNLVHGANFDYGIEVRNFGNNPGFPGGLLTAQVSNNLVYGQNGNTGIPAGLVASADGNNASLAVQMVNNTVADGRRGVAISARTDLGASITGGLFNNVVAFHSQIGISIGAGLPGFSNSNDLTFGNGVDFFVPGPGTVTSDPLFANRPTHDYSLAVGSPAVDAGLDPALPPGFTLDLAGQPRRVDVIDIGAYEMPLPAPVPALQPVALALLAALLASVYSVREFSLRRRT